MPSSWHHITDIWNENDKGDDEATKKLPPLYLTIFYWIAILQSVDAEQLVHGRGNNSIVKSSNQTFAHSFHHTHFHPQPSISNQQNQTNIVLKPQATFDCPFGYQLKGDASIWWYLLLHKCIIAVLDWSYNWRTLLQLFVFVCVLDFICLCNVIIFGSICVW